jgi:hypothetical protein
MKHASTWSIGAVLIFNYDSRNDASISYIQEEIFELRKKNHVCETRKCNKLETNDLGF